MGMVHLLIINLLGNSRGSEYRPIQENKIIKTIFLFTIKKRELIIKKMDYNPLNKFHAIMVI